MVRVTALLDNIIEVNHKVKDKLLLYFCAWLWANKKREDTYKFVMGGGGGGEKKVPICGDIT